MNSRRLIWKQEKMVERCDRLLARIAPHPVLTAFLTLLGDQTHRHALELKHLQKQPNAPYRNRRFLTRGTVMLSRVKGIVSQLEFNPDQLHSYESIRDLVEQNEHVYRELADQSCIPRLNVLYKQLAREEHIHFVLIRDLCKLLTNVCPQPQRSIA
jgi:hypothetical protein